ncbi:MAG: sigma-70 family RNA polymerase sigma factor [Planctomycetota bacterium]|jgi:RNA polymerase sigma factor (sigma-70 family)
MQTGMEWAPDFDVYLKAIGRHRLLTGEQERALAREVQAGSESARDTLIVSNLRLVVRVARAFGNRGLGLADLVCEGNLGLIRAVEKFDPDAGCRFSTYAVWWIKQSVRRALERAHVVRIPSNMLQRAQVWKRTERAMAATLDRSPTRAEVHRRMEVTGIKSRALGAALDTLDGSRFSVDVPLGGDDATLRDVIPDERAASPCDEADRKAHLERLASLLQALDERSRCILELRFGLGGRESMSLVSIGEVYGLTRERVRQLEQRALARLAIAFKHGARALAPRKHCGSRHAVAR